MEKTRALPDDPVMRMKILKNVEKFAPYYSLLGMKVERVEPGHAILSMPFRKELTHPLGIMHGGALASLADSAVAIALLAEPGKARRVVTIDLTINYFEPVSEGTVLAECRIAHKGRSIAFGEVDMSVDGRLVARATSNYKIK